MITCHTCNFTNPSAFKGSKSELQYLRSTDTDGAEKLFFCTFECYLEKCLENEFFRNERDPEVPRDMVAFEDYKNEHRDEMAEQLLRNSGVRSFLERTKADITLPPEEMDVEEEISTWADM